MIVTVTLNPAIDRTVTADRLVFDDRAYVLSTHEGAGGRGINASSVIHAFGAKTLAICTCGGKRLEQLLKDCQFAVELVRIKGESRTNLTITDKQGLTVKLNERGPKVERDELDRVEKTVAAKLPKADWVMICGSLPPGVPSDFYYKLIKMASQRGVKTLLDTDGDALATGLEAQPTVVSPNQQEAERLLNRALLTKTHAIEAAERIRSMGAESVIVSLGSRGAVGASKDGIIEVVPPHIEAVCPIGAGDAMAAAFVWAKTKKKDFGDALRWGVAAGTASARLPGMLYASLEQTREVYQNIELRQPV